MKPMVHEHPKTFKRVSKMLLFVALFAFQFGHSQEGSDTPAMLAGKNEVRVDLLTLALRTELNLTYEHFLNKDWSVGVFGGYADSQKLNDDFDSGYRNNVPKYEVNPFVRYNLSKSQTSFYFAEAFVSANGGDFKETVRLVDDSGNGYYVNEKSSYSDFGVGAALGYKLYIKEKFGIELLVGFGRNLFNTDKSPDTLSRVGLSLGYRF
ncbi:MAG: DUF3575 domain-containing protein [Flavobacterium sp.]|nr:MAG: DUF3575 domain-containing protein [Flavobacterium sp.]